MDQERQFRHPSEPGLWEGRASLVEALNRRRAWNCMGTAKMMSWKGLAAEHGRDSSHLILIISPCGHGVCDRRKTSSKLVISVNDTHTHPVSLLPSVQLGHGCPFTPLDAPHICVTSELPRNWLSSSNVLSILSHHLTPYVLAKLPRA